jgi:hypothetical protein
MADNVMERTSQLIAQIERELPDFASACKSKATDFVIMHQDSFAPELGSNELVLLGKAIKYAGLLQKEVRIIPSLRQPS